MKRLAIGVCLVTASMLAPSLARADDEDTPPLPPPSTSTSAERAEPKVTTTPNGATAANVDTVHLRNGGMYRGRVTEIVPGDHVTIITATNETKKIAWPEVDRVIVGATAVPPPPTSAAPAPAAVPPMVGPKARVHITSPRNVILYRRPAGTNSWVQACASPCDIELPIGDSYRVAGNGVAQSKEFTLNASPGGATDIVVDPPSGGGMVLGGILAGGGATAAYVGLLMTLVGLSNSSRYSSTTTRSDSKKVRDAGLVTMGVSAAITGVGILVFLNAAKTDTSQRSAGGDAKREGTKDAFLRLPEWKTASSGADATAPAPTFPFVLQGSF